MVLSLRFLVFLPFEKKKKNSLFDIYVPFRNNASIAFLRFRATACTFAHEDGHARCVHSSTQSCTRACVASTQPRTRASVPRRQMFKRGVENRSC